MLRTSMSDESRKARTEGGAQAPRQAQEGYYIDPEGNECLDRRIQPTPALSKYTFTGGRRRGLPYAEGGAHTFVDVYGTKVWVALSLFLALNFLDAHFT
ncbi:MAG: hypothetical protein MK209_08570, partial [Planctomycetes bacterium]|nr:hypothetical protein [Planctomycetota bacterium]